MRVIAVEIVQFIDFSFQTLKGYQDSNLDLWNKDLNSNLFGILEKLYSPFCGQVLAVFEAQNPL